MHLAKSPQPYSMSTPACSFVLSEITGTAGNRDEKKNKSDAGAVLSSRFWRTTLFHMPTHLHQTHSPCSSACLPLSLRLLASLHLSLLSSTPLPPPSLHPCWHAAVKGSSRRVQLWNQPSGWAHPGGFFLYVCGFLVKLQISTTEQAHPLPQIIPPLPSDDLQESVFFNHPFLLQHLNHPRPMVSQWL